MQTDDPDIYAVSVMTEITNFILPASKVLPLVGTANIQGQLAADYPSTHQTTLRLAFQPATGRRFSAQILGRKGVNQRIEVLSVALQSRMTAFDLKNFELSYPSEYGTAKAPVKVLGMVANNLLRGDLHLVTADEFEGQLDDWQIIDLRSPESFAQGHIPSAVNTPIDTTVIIRIF